MQAQAGVDAHAALRQGRGFVARQTLGYIPITRTYDLMADALYHQLVSPYPP